jgi:hypothetical protein
LGTARLPNEPPAFWFDVTCSGLTSKMAPATIWSIVCVAIRPDLHLLPVEPDTAFITPSPR